LIRTHLLNVKLRNANLSGAYLHNANLSGAELSGGTARCQTRPRT
jgi:uncharacterized protein YjbI with pentapeptide repeats